LAEIESRRINRRADTWDFATAVEACIGLQQHEDALTWLRRYIESDFTDAFELGSTYRQLTQVWQLTPSEPPGDKILPALKAALLEQQGSNIEITVDEAVNETLNELAEDLGYEKILGTEGFRSFKWFQKCMQRAKAVAQVEDTVGEAVGTAFLVRGGDLKPELGDELLLLTNAHVVSKNSLISDALPPEKVSLTFELWRNEVPLEFTVEQIWTSSPDKMDATLLRPTPAIEGLEPVPIASELPLINDDGEEKSNSRAYVIGHPGGRKLAFSIHDNNLLDADDRLLHYRSPTEPGSSGSPVFNEDWDLIGLHHKGLKRMPRLNGKEGTYPANEGIWIQAIINKLKSDDLDDIE
jgi:V8-like Glu-specific endopeptidase